MRAPLQQTSILGVPVTHWLILLLACLAGYWPLSSMMFSLKNDAQVYFLPNRFLISDALQNGVLPWWTPYQHMGYPLHGDMQSGAWNPFVWLLSLTGRYNMHTLQWETLLYIFLGGLGIYKLSGISPVHPLARLMAAIAYMFSGFIIDTGQITVWTASAAFIPFCLLYLHRILFSAENTIRNALKAGLSLYLLLVAGYPSFLIMMAYIWLIAVMCRLPVVWKNKQERLNESLSLGSSLLITATVFALLSLPAILSYIDYLPYYHRGNGTSLSEAQENPFTVFGFLSFLSPFSVTRPHDWLSTNPVSRSAYIGAFSLFFLAGWYRKKINGTGWFILTGTLLIWLFSLGDLTPVREWFYVALPGMNVFRHPGTMRIFCLTGMLLLATPLFSDFLLASVEEKKSYRIRAWGFAGIYAALALLAIPGTQLAHIWKQQNILNRDSLKHIFNNLTFNDGLFLDAVLQCVCFLFFIWLLGRQKQSFIMSAFFMLFTLNLVLPAQLSIPATVVSRVSPHDLNQFIAQSPKQYPAPSLEKSLMGSSLENDSLDVFFPAAVYKKEVTWIAHNVNPSVSNRMKRLDVLNQLRRDILSNPFCYFADTILRYRDTLAELPESVHVLFSGEKNKEGMGKGPSSINIELFRPGHLLMTTHSAVAKPLVVAQQYNKHWKLLIDGKPAVVQQGNLAFMYAWVDAGQHHVEWKYEPYYLMYTSIGSLICLLGLLALLIWISLKRSY